MLVLPLAKEAVSYSREVSSKSERISELRIERAQQLEYKLSSPILSAESYFAVLL